jgi:O-antigen ligase
MKFDSRKAARVVFYVLLALAPFGTRYIGYMGNIGGVDIEAGTVSMFGTQILGTLFVLLALSYAIDNRKKFRDWKEDPFSIALPLVLVSAYLSALLSIRFTSSLIVASWLALGIAIFVGVRIVKPSTLIATVALMVGALFQVLLAAVQFTTQHVFASKWLGMARHLPYDSGTFVVGSGDNRWLRAYGTFPHPNELGTYLAIGALLSLAFALREGKWSKRLGLASAVACVFGLVLTFSRGAALAFFAGLVALAVPGLICTGKWKPRVTPALIASVIGLIALLSALLVFREPVMTRVTSEGRLEKISIDERGSQMRDAGLLFNEHALLGVGPGMMPYAMHRMDPERNPYDYQYVHNSALLVAVETGFVGVVIWSVLMLLIAAAACQVSRSGKGKDWIPFLPALGILAVVSLFDHFLWSSWFGHLIFWSLAGLAVTGSAPVKRKRRSILPLQ